MERYTITAPEPVAAGKATIRYEFTGMIAKVTVELK